MAPRSRRRRYDISVRSTANCGDGAARQRVSCRACAREPGHRCRHLGLRDRRGLIRLAREELIREHPTTVSVKKLQALFEETTPALTQGLDRNSPVNTRAPAKADDEQRASRAQTQCNMPAEMMQAIKLILHPLSVWMRLPYARRCAYRSRSMIMRALTMTVVLLVFGTPSAHALVAVDASSSSSNEFGTTLTWTTHGGLRIRSPAARRRVARNTRRSAASPSTAFH